jgi:hypothetical protein
MNDELMEMAKKAGFQVFRAEGLLPNVPQDIFIGNMCATKEVKAFAALAAAAEREKVAKQWEQWHGFDKHTVAAFIRARGETK